MSKYTPELVEQIKELAANGNADKEICQKLKIGRTIFYKWKNEKVNFVNILKEARIPCINDVEGALYKNAMGSQEYTEEHVHVRKEKNKDDEIIREITEVKKLKKITLAQTIAQIFFLKNRDPENWSDKHDYTHKVEGIEERTEAISGIFESFKAERHKKISRESSPIGS
ncbi:hypothetical protein LCGC14_1547920 [marine sediment metagenome]|uniref:Homeodomain phBC6A51-type domain-containing protein n=1 Tax=marine sediment metagenome TaxID=412755 RepID=A0A0F9L757_9ZZZZ